MLDVLREANANAMSVEKRDSKWRLREKATDFKSSLVRESLYKEKTNAFVVIEVGLAGDKQPLKRIAIYPDIKKYPNVAEELTFRDIAFDFAQGPPVSQTHRGDQILGGEISRQDRLRDSGFTTPRADRKRSLGSEELTNDTLSIESSLWNGKADTTD